MVLYLSQLFGFNLQYLLPQWEELMALAIEVAFKKVLLSARPPTGWMREWLEPLLDIGMILSMTLSYR